MSKMERIRSCCNKWGNIPGIFRGILFIDLTFKATNVVEKLIWLTIGLVGLLWAGFFITNLITQRNTFIVRSFDKKLSDMKYPAMTICSKTSTKFAIAERMGNHLNGNSEKLKHVLKIFAVAITFMSTHENATKIYTDSAWPKYNCRSSYPKQECKVSRYSVSLKLSLIETEEGRYLDKQLSMKS